MEVQTNTTEVKPTTEVQEVAEAVRAQTPEQVEVKETTEDQAPSPAKAPQSPTATT
jgi:hypothetical protein